MLKCFQLYADFSFKTVANLASKLRDSMHQSVKRIPGKKQINVCLINLRPNCLQGFFSFFIRK